MNWVQRCDDGVWEWVCIVYNVAGKFCASYFIFMVINVFLFVYLFLVEKLHFNFQTLF